MSGPARFRYALQPVLLTRQWDLDALMLDLNRINENVQACQQAYDRLMQEIANVSLAWQAENGPESHLAVDRFVLVTRYIADLAVQRKQHEMQLAELEQERAAMIEQVAKAKRGVDAAEKHRDLMRARFIQLQLRAEFKDADDQWSNAQTRMVDYDKQS
jgi:flagellar biosynthesis chaperone FliJ